MSSGPPPARIEPYRLLFPLGAAIGIAGALLWVFSAAGWIPYPAITHPILMIEGFETCFVIGFLLTALPGLLHAERCHPVELTLAVLLTLGVAVSTLIGNQVTAQADFVLTLLLLLLAAARRARGRRAPAPELIFVLIGLLLGLAGAAMMLAGALGVAAEPAPRFALRLVSLGMVLSLVLGMGGLLVPTFLGIPRPLEIAGLGGPAGTGGRLRLYLGVALLLVLAFVLEALGHRGLGAWSRAIAATPLLLFVWKLHVRPPRSDRFAFALRAAGVSVLLGLWLAAWVPLQAVAAYHLVFIGGFGMLTLGIGTRVVAAHGGYGLAGEPRLLTPLALVAILIALATRIAAAFALRSGAALLAWSGVAWTVAWVAWLGRALPMVARLRSTTPRIEFQRPVPIESPGGPAGRAP